MTLTFIGKKKGMTQVFDASGAVVPCTVIEAQPNIVVQIKTKKTDGYNAIQLGAFKKKKEKMKPVKGHFEKAGCPFCEHLFEARVEDAENYKAGQEITASMFVEGDEVDVTGTSKGKGFQGAMKLHGFAGMPASHGCSRYHRGMGSTGMRTTPGRCFPGGRRASRMGGDKTTQQNLTIVKVFPEKNIILVKGSVPGCINSVVHIKKAIKR